MSKAPLVVFASGRGSGFAAIAEACRTGALAAEVKALVTNVAGCGATELAKKFGIAVIARSHDVIDRTDHEAAILGDLEKITKGLTPFEKNGAGWFVLAGYMRVFTAEFVDRFRLVNIHPSLLPAFPGMAGYRKALSHGVKITGATVHLVTAGVDEGPIVAQEPVVVQENDSFETLEARGLEAEHKLYVASLQRLITEPWELGRGPSGRGRRRVHFTGGPR